jgi:CheY-like chemotaxis protein/DNA-binding XRE family transcriptional regulator
MTEINSYVGEKLRLRRKKLNLSQSDLAQMLGISSQQIHKYESGLNKISASMLFTCAKLLHVPVIYFYEGLNLGDNIVNIHTDNKNLCCERTIPISILLIEDNPVDEMLVREALSQSNIDTSMHAVHDGIEALQFLRRKKNTELFPKPDVIFLDLNIPKRSGLEILKEMKQDRELMDIPVILLTNSINPDDMTRGYKLGACGFMSKSFDVNEFNRNITLAVEYWSKAMILPSMQQVRVTRPAAPLLEKLGA